MKKILFILVASSVGIVAAHAAPFWTDTMAYPLGSITTNSSGVWAVHSGSQDALVVNYPGSPAATAGNRYEINQSRSGDIHRFFDAATNAYPGQTLYASFTMSVTSLPANPGGTYFAHFMDTAAGATGFGISFRGKLFLVIPPNPYPYISAAPGSFRLGVAQMNGDFSGGTGGPNQVIPIDLALNTDYQVVLKEDTTLASATVWVNPLSESDNAVSSGPTGDFGSVTNPMSAFAFRQSTGEGVIDVRDVSTGLSFADVMTNTPTTPLIGLQPVGVTNYSGNAALLAVAASGMGLGYQWVHDGTPRPGATSANLVINNLQGSDAGFYYCIVSNAISVSSATAYLSVDTTPTPPSVAVAPTNVTVSVGEKATLVGFGAGTGPLTYQWQQNGANVVDGPGTLPGDQSITSGSTSPILTISNISTNQAGSYTLIISGGAGSPATTVPVTLTVVPPRPVTIAYLRTLFDTSTWKPTDTTTLFNINGVITTYTNQTSQNTSSYYIQDESGAGINLFITGTGATSFRPALGDWVSASGTLWSFNNNFELQCLTANPYQTYSVVSNGATLPAPKVVPLSVSNNLAASEAVDGSLVMVTNVYFTSTSIGTANTTIIATNSEGVRFAIFFPAAQNQTLKNATLPKFAWTVTGIFARFNNVWEVVPTRLADVVATAPSPVTASISRSGDDVTLNWTAVPISYSAPGGLNGTGGYSYSVYAASSPTGPWTPLATGMAFNTPAGKFVDAGVTGPKFYQISSP